LNFPTVPALVVIPVIEPVDNWELLFDAVVVGIVVARTTSLASNSNSQLSTGSITGMTTRAGTVGKFKGVGTTATFAVVTKLRVKEDICRKYTVFLRALTR
jgi:hypothetical protein